MVGAGPSEVPAGAAARRRHRTGPARLPGRGPPHRENPAGAHPYDQVTVDKVKPKADRPRAHVLRAEFHLAGDPASPLRQVPLNPDPLQPIVDAVAAVRADLGDLAEVILDIQPVPNWRLRLKRWHLAATARARAQAEARKATRRALADADAVEDSLTLQLARLLQGNSPAPRRTAMTVKPQPVDAATTWGRLADDVGLVRIQLLVRCASDVEGRAQTTLKLLTAALDIYASRSRLRVDGARLGPFHWSANHPLRRASFDRRWAGGVFAPRGDSWLNIAEIGGLLKPATVHCRVPITPGTVPEYALGEPLMPHGWHRGPDGASRLIASPLEETLFSISVGKSFYGKTTRALVQAIAVAAAGQGVFFLDPHGDSWTQAAPTSPTRTCATGSGAST
ncbi:hypothetical protein ACFQZC_38435 [Streptacidiphilus monticola]